MKKIFSILIMFVLFSTSISAANIITKNFEGKEVKTFETQDFDPTVDLKINVTINEIRAFDDIDKFSEPDFYVKIIIEKQTFKSVVFEENQRYVKPNWVVEYNVPDDKEWVNITIQLWDANPIKDKLCDIARNDNYKTNRKDITIQYNIKTGHWIGDDHINWPHNWNPDYSGYGRASGTDDNSIYQNDDDCELWFDITQNDYDGDGIPYWTEVNVFETDPTIDDRGRDDDDDGVPIEWEYKWGYTLGYDHENETYIHKWDYHPFEYNDHENIDFDADSINNYEEYLTSAWRSDPFRKDIFVELDQMNGSSDGTIPACILPDASKDLIKDSFDRQNIVFHLDDGSIGEQSGSEMIPFYKNGEQLNRTDLDQIYTDYFLHGDENNWRRGVFHYGVVVYKTVSASGFIFKRDAFQISSNGLDLKSTKIFTRDRDVVYASAYMHELGHSLGLTWLLGHTKRYQPPLMYLFLLKTLSYKSIMNYAYMYGFLFDLVDYSDGSNGKNDYDDWSNIDYSYFEY